MEYVLLFQFRYTDIETLIVSNWTIHLMLEKSFPLAMYKYFHLAIQIRISTLFGGKCVFVYSVSKETRNLECSFYGWYILLGAMKLNN